MKKDLKWAIERVGRSGNPLPELSPERCTQWERIVEAGSRSGVISRDQARMLALAIGIVNSRLFVDTDIRLPNYPKPPAEAFRLALRLFVAVTQIQLTLDGAANGQTAPGTG